MQKPSSVSFFVILFKKGEQRLVEKRETQQFSTPIRIYPNSPCCYVTLLFPTFPKVEKLWIGYLDSTYKFDSMTSYWRDIR